ncbi:Pyrimidine reductase, riboflavin biosynthesis [Hymenobacter gelipurpurascens]|uniref:Pyrimidine reductase, riboflavin biosynthesis n=1 Tax=Hymenobacter gelipurpurascens TaxID=89968 RepID=A0A212UET3_9BACT|nr:RibD family protein [Hymenobacter gelipurpurascens]SNC76641.1 Pyrimidine reductase, riboflavin biosynthesis [Hymenobacter gelipurpurascens]
MKPRLICHMMSSLDGRIILSRWGAQPNTKEYETTAATFEAEAWLCGRVTMEKDFTDGLAPDLKPVTEPLDRSDFVAEHGAESFAVAVDAHGKLGWESGYIDDDHVISVLTEQVPDAYLAYLREKGVSYIFGGTTELDFAAVLEKLGQLFPIRTILLEGGGHLNGSLLRAGLVDELSLLHYPVVDGAATSPTIFEQGEQPGPPRSFKLLSVEQRPGGILWLRYEAGVA